MNISSRTNSTTSDYTSNGNRSVDGLPQDSDINQEFDWKAEDASNEDKMDENTDEYNGKILKIVNLMMILN